MKDINHSSTAAVRGMSNIYDSVSTSVASAIKKELTEHFGTGLYYRMKNGEKEITAEQQDFIAATFRKYGVNDAPVYDSVVG